MDIERVIGADEGDDAFQVNVIATFVNGIVECLDCFKLPVFDVAFLAPEGTAGHGEQEGRGQKSEDGVYCSWVWWCVVLAIRDQ